ncbi:MAG: hypothetical protein P4L76_15910 [Beijerinckiaceae bacterium]|nr:hypothetical protein [Beijerinckiaceae bacterium]
MTSIPPPQGMTDADYESIEAAVTETVRGRWFLAEFARRIRAADSKLLLEGMDRLETLVRANQAQVPPPQVSADPSIRLLIQRIKEIAARLEETSRDMRNAGADDQFCEAVDLQARAVAGLMRMGTTPPASQSSAPALAAPLKTRLAAPREPAIPAVARADAEKDPRLEVLSGLDRLSLAQKTALFS